MDRIKILRSRIDLLDTQIIDLLNQRFNFTNQIGEIKKASNLNVLDENREAVIYKKISNHSHSPQISVIYTTIMKESKKAQGK